MFEQMLRSLTATDTVLHSDEVILWPVSPGNFYDDHGNTCGQPQQITGQLQMGLQL